MALTPMKFKPNGLRVASGLAAVAATLALAVPAVRSQTRTISIDGSSTVFPITEAVAEEFQNAKGDAVRVTVGISGSGGGFKKFCNGETDISNASRPIKPSEMEACKENGIQYIELPVAFDALTVVVNPENTWAETMTIEDLETIWEPDAQGSVTQWNQVRSQWPDADLNLYGPGADSGTFDYFTEAVVGESGASRGDYTASEDDNVLVQGVANDPNALGYFGYAYYEANKDRLKAVGIDSGDGPVYPSAETVENGTYQPLARPLFVYVNAEAAKDTQVEEFIEFYIDNAPVLVSEVGYVTLPSRAYNAALQNFRDGKVGTIFGGDEETIGLSIEEVLQRETLE
jgi:phosphate transport system substrate-binding protein